MATITPQVSSTLSHEQIVWSLPKGTVHNSEATRIPPDYDTVMQDVDTDQHYGLTVQIMSSPAGNTMATVMQDVDTDQQYGRIVQIMSSPAGSKMASSRVLTPTSQQVRLSQELFLMASHRMNHAVTNIPDHNFVTPMLEGNLSAHADYTGALKGLQMVGQKINASSDGLQQLQDSAGRFALHTERRSLASTRDFSPTSQQFADPGIPASNADQACDDVGAKSAFDGSISGSNVAGVRGGTNQDFAGLLALKIDRHTPEQLHALLTGKAMAQTVRATNRENSVSGKRVCNQFIPLTYNISSDRKHDIADTSVHVSLHPVVTTDVFSHFLVNTCITEDCTRKMNVRLPINAEREVEYTHNDMKLTANMCSKRRLQALPEAAVGTPLRLHTSVSPEHVDNGPVGANAISQWPVIHSLMSAAVLNMKPADTGPVGALLSKSDSASTRSLPAASQQVLLPSIPHCKLKYTTAIASSVPLNHNADTVMLDVYNAMSPATSTGQKQRRRLKQRARSIKVTPGLSSTYSEPQCTSLISSLDDARANFVASPQVSQQVCISSIDANDIQCFSTYKTAASINSSSTTMFPRLDVRENASTKARLSTSTCISPVLLQSNNGVMDQFSVIVANEEQHKRQKLCDEGPCTPNFSDDSYCGPKA